MAQTAFVPVGTAQQLISGLDPKLFMWIISGTQIGLGAVPLQTEFVLDLGSEAIRDASTSPLPANVPAVTVAPRARLSTGGRYLLECKGKTVECSSLKDMLQKGLLLIEEHSPGMLNKLTKRKARTKRIVAQNESNLFEDQKLVKKFAAPLKAGWFYGTNNSTTETKGWLMRACEIAGLQWGKDFDTSL